MQPRRPSIRVVAAIESATVTPSSSEKPQLVDAIRRLAIVHQQVTLSSGRQADYYVDMRRVTLDGVASGLVGRAMRELTADLEFDAVGGLTLGADPVAYAMMHAAAQAHGRLDTFVVRKDQKAHGMQRLIEGTEVSGRRVLAVDDTTTTGSSVLTAVDALRSAGAEVVAVAVVVDRDTGAQDKIAAADLEYRYAVGASDLGLVADNGSS